MNKDGKAVPIVAGRWRSMKRRSESTWRGRVNVPRSVRGLVRAMARSSR